MLVGPSTAHKLNVASSAAATVWIAGSVIAVSTATPPVVDGSVLNELIFASIGAANQDVVVGAAGLIKRLMEMSIRNAHATTSTDVTVTRTDGTNTPEVIKATLLAGEKLDYNGAGTWLHYDSNGALYPSVGNAALQSDQEAGTSTSKYVSPGVQQFHPSAAKFWFRADTAGGLTASYNMTSLTDTGTGIVGATIATDFSSATGYCCQVSVEATATTWAVANTRECHIRNATLAAGTVSFDCIDNTATTSLVKDPASWHVAGFGDQA